MEKIAMISQPMNGRTGQEILETEERAAAILTKKGYIILGTYFEDSEQGRKNIKNLPLYHLAKSLKCMSTCHAVYFCKGWEKARGCRIEHEAAKVYGLDIIYEED